MAVLLSVIAIVVAIFAWLAARESAEGPAWTWKLLNAGRRPALDVRLAPHWGPNQGRHLP